MLAFFRVRSVGCIDALFLTSQLPKPCGELAPVDAICPVEARLRAENPFAFSVGLDRCVINTIVQELLQGILAGPVLPLLQVDVPLERRTQDGLLTPTGRWLCFCREVAQIGHSRCTDDSVTVVLVAVTERSVAGAGWLLVLLQDREEVALRPLTHEHVGAGYAGPTDETCSRSLRRFTPLDMCRHDMRSSVVSVDIEVASRHFPRSVFDGPPADQVVFRLQVQ